MVYVLFTLLCLHLVSTQRPPTPSIISATPDKEENLGGSVELSCTVQNVNEFHVQWSKVDKDHVRDPVNLFFSNIRVIQDARFSAHVDKEDGIYTLQIKNVTDTDAGFYKCSVQVNLDVQVSREIRLQVKYPPVIYDNSTSTVVVPLNGSTKLECFVAGHPYPRVVWSRENNAVLPSGELAYLGNSLKIVRVGREHAGVYYCSADNQVGTSVKKAIRLVVEFAPVVQTARSRVGQALQFDAELECRVWAEPAAAIVWKMNGSQVPHTQHYRIAHHATANDYNASVLHIASVERSQYGLYTCEATNKYGKTMATVEFYETDHKECSPTCGTSSLWCPDLRLLASASTVVIFAYVIW